MFFFFEVIHNINNNNINSFIYPAKMIQLVLKEIHAGINTCAALNMIQNIINNIKICNMSIYNRNACLVLASTTASVTDSPQPTNCPSSQGT